MIAYDKLDRGPGKDRRAHARIPRASGRRAAPSTKTGSHAPVALQEWDVEPESTRAAILTPTAVPPGRAALQVEFGAPGGEGEDTVLLGRRLALPWYTDAVCVRCYAFTTDLAPVRLGLALTLAAGPPYLACEPTRLPLRQSTTVAFDVRGFTADYLAAVTRLILVVVTAARGGYLILERVAIW